MGSALDSASGKLGKPRRIGAGAVGDQLLAEHELRRPVDRVGRHQAAVAQIKVAPSVKDLNALRTAMGAAQMSGRWREVELPNGETARSLIPPVTASSYEAQMGALPALGAHTEAVLKEFGLN